ncbi:MAG: hypothetical protein KTR31_36435 [Myxococcales bacterium]|nr:hypothetical protein [Myxococcales bacterium]
MDQSNWVLFGLVALIGANQLLVRMPVVRSQPLAFWALNVVDLVVGGLVLGFGLPGYDHAPIVSWVVGLLLVLHVAQNLQLRSSWEQEKRKEAQAERDAERKARRQAREAAEE